MVIISTAKIKSFLSISDNLSEEAKSVLSIKKKKTGDNSNDSNAITIALNFKRYVFDKSMAQ